jgi:hypothetical protein
MKWTGYAACMEKLRYSDKLQSKSLKGKEHLEDNGWEDNIKIYIKEIGSRGMGSLTSCGKTL